MKKILFTLALLTLGMSASAQVENLDEVELLGSWNVTDGDGIFTGRLPIYHNSYRKPVAFTFNDNKASAIRWEYAGPDYDWQQIPGFWVSHTSDRYILHFLLNTDYSTGGDGLSVLNFVVTQFSNGAMTLQTLSGDGTMQLSKEETASVRSLSPDTTANGKAYDLNGVELLTPDTAKGIVIQNGKKTVRK